MVGPLVSEGYLASQTNVSYSPTYRITGKSITGMTSSTNLKKWALGKDYKSDPWQGFTSPQFQDLISKMGDDGEKECE